MPVRCEVHLRHEPPVLRTVVHHIQPLAMGGKDVEENRVWVCDTGHYNIHRLLGMLERNGRMTAVGTVQERLLAMRGYEAWVAAGRPGTRVFEEHFGGSDGTE